jgi:endonuclease/exonuclease/phosphatase family metal-dependent hydrolase
MHSSGTLIRAARSAVLLLSLFFVSLNLSIAQEIRVLTFNIRYASFDSPPQNWDGRKESVFNILRGNDFIGMQEVVPVQMKEISAYLGSDYGFFYRTRDADSTRGEGCPVIYDNTRWKALRNGHFWLSDTPGIPGSNTWNAAFPRMVTYGVFRNIASGDSVVVVNTHFDHIAQDARERSVALILAWFSGDIASKPFIFMGDLNVNPSNAVYLLIMESGNLIDSFVSAGETDEFAGSTFHGWKAEKPTERIDYIFVNDRLKIRSCKVIHDKYQGFYPSDHFPLNGIFYLQQN